MQDAWPQMGSKRNTTPSATMKLSEFLHSGRVQQVLIGIRASFWFVPVLLMVSAMASALGLVEFDRHFRTDLRDWWPSLFMTEPDGARSMLSAIATSMATVAGVVFSITTVTLALASSQYTSRVLRNFMRDRVTQVVLGIFIGVYIYCLLVLRTITGEGTTFVPSVAVLFAIALAVFAAVLFIVFIHHTAASIQAVEIIRAISLETQCAIDRAFPDKASGQDDADPRWQDPGGTWTAVPSLEMGYLQAVKLEALRDFAEARGITLRMDRYIGDFIAKGDALASIKGAAVMDPPLVEDVNKFYAIDSYRTIDQDPGLGFRQLVDIAIKALSPGINDTTTAILAIDQLDVLLACCASRRMGRSLHKVGPHTRLIENAPAFGDMLSLSFNQIIENAEGNTEVILRVLSSIAYLAPRVKGQAHAAALQRQLRTVEEIAVKTLKTPMARERVAELQRQAHASLAAAIPSPLRSTQWRTR